MKPIRVTIRKPAGKSGAYFYQRVEVYDKADADKCLAFKDELITYWMQRYEEAASALIEARSRLAQLSLR